jgi:hypothetical protein
MNLRLTPPCMAFETPFINLLRAFLLPSASGFRSCTAAWTRRPGFRSFTSSASMANGMVDPHPIIRTVVREVNDV